MERKAVRPCGAVTDPAREDGGNQPGAMKTRGVPEKHYSKTGFHQVVTLVLLKSTSSLVPFTLKNFSA